MVKELFQKENYGFKYNVVFGLGTTGKLVVDLINSINLKIDCILTGDGYCSSTEYKGLPIYEISNFPFDKEECNILFTVKKDVQHITKLLKKKKFNNIVYINSKKAYFELLNIYYKEYFKENNIKINDKEILKFKELKIINPFQIDKGTWDIFLSEIGDLILPAIMKDYSRIDEGTYEEGNVVLNENDVVFDCGAHIGLFSSLAAFKKCNVFAFEPAPNNIFYLEKSKFIYPELINICPYALSNLEGYAKLETAELESSEAHIINQTMEEEGTIQVETTTIDKFVEKNNILKVDFIKADIEGAERLMLMGAKKTLARFAPKLSICTYHLDDDPQILEKIIKEANPNYVIEHKWKKLYGYVPNM
jgi:FkbM family methyltransferase